MIDAAAKAASRLESRISRTKHTLTEASTLRARGQLTQRSLDAIAESSFASSYAAFEQFIEDIFFASLLGDTAVQGAVGIVKFADRAQAELIIIDRGKYLTWLPWDRGIQINAARYLVDGLPFSRIERHDDERALLEESRLLRNAIAHASSSAMKSVHRFTSSMPVRRRTVAGYLQASSQGATRADVLMNNFRAVASALTRPTTVEAKKFLSPERPYSTGDTPGQGLFLCLRCRMRHVVRGTRSALPGCSQCNGNRKAAWQRQW